MKHKHNQVKNLQFSILLTIALVLSSCSTSGKTTVLNFLATPPAKAVEVDDYLFYWIRGQSQIIIYDPVRQTHSAFLPDWDIIGFSAGPKNRLAFSTGPAEKMDIYTLESPFTDNAPLKITQASLPEIYLLSWSPDGRYLAYVTEPADEKTLFVWDGTTATPIYHYNGSIDELVWSLDGRLAFREYDDNQDDILIWDGNTIANASQNPLGGDSFPAWSPDGQLAFLSYRDKADDIYVWDGRSTMNGIPDITTYTNVAPELTDYYSEPVWTSSGSLSFIAFEPNNSIAAQVFEWDGRTATNISQNPDFHNGGQQWSRDGNWAFITFFSSKQLLYVRDADNQPLLTTEGQYPPAWSQNGLLMFCRYDGSEWVLLVWDGRSINQVARGGSIGARWNNGTEVFCSSG